MIQNKGGSSFTNSSTTCLWLVAEIATFMGKNGEKMGKKTPPLHPKVFWDRTAEHQNRSFFVVVVFFNVLSISRQSYRMHRLSEYFMWFGLFGSCSHLSRQVHFLSLKGMLYVTKGNKYMQ